VPLRRADLFFDEIEIVEQPHTRGRNAVMRLCRRGEPVHDGNQGMLVRHQPRQQPIRTLIWVQRMRCRERFGMLFHLVGAQQFCAQGRFVALCRASCADMFAQAAPGGMNSSAAHLQRIYPFRHVSYGGVQCGRFGTPGRQAGNLRILVRGSAIDGKNLRRDMDTRRTVHPGN
jgi:hypothetical protein